MSNNNEESINSDKVFENLFSENPHEEKAAPEKEKNSFRKDKRSHYDNLLDLFHCTAFNLNDDWNDNEKLEKDGFSLLINIPIPKFNKNEQTKCSDDFAIYFMATCAQYTLYTSKRCVSYFSINDSICQERAKKLADIIMECLSRIPKNKDFDDTVKYIEGQCSSYKLEWLDHKIKIFKTFIETSKCNYEDFPFVFWLILKNFKWAFCNKNVHFICDDHKDITWLAAYHAFIDHRKFLLQEMNKLMIKKLIKHVKEDRNERKQKDKFKNNTQYDWSWNLVDEPDIAKILNYDINTHFTPNYDISNKRYQHPIRTLYKNAEYGIYTLVKETLGDSSDSYGHDITRTQLVNAFKNILAASENVLSKFPSIYFLMFWNIDSLEYSEFRDLFVQTKDSKGLGIFKNLSKELKKTIESVEYENFSQKTFQGQTAQRHLQSMFFFSLYNLVTNPSKYFFSSNQECEQIQEQFKQALADGSWNKPRTQKELFNKIAQFNEIPELRLPLDFTKLTDSAFPATETALSLVYNLSSFIQSKSTKDLIQQVNFIDTLRDKKCKYHKLQKPTNPKKDQSNSNNFYNDNKGNKKRLLDNEIDDMKNIDCGFILKNFSQKLPLRNSTVLNRNILCRCFNETNGFIREATNAEYFSKRYKSMLREIDIHPARNMFTHHSLFSSTEKLLEKKNYNDLLTTLYNIKRHLEGECLLRKYTNSLIHQAYSLFPLNDKLEPYFSKEMRELVELVKKVLQSFKDYQKDYELYIKQKNTLIYELNCFLNSFDKLQVKIWNSKVYSKPKVKQAKFYFDMFNDNTAMFIDHLNNLIQKEDFESIREYLDKLQQSFNSLGDAFLDAQNIEFYKKNFRTVEDEISLWKALYLIKQKELDLKNLEQALDMVDYPKNNPELRQDIKKAEEDIKNDRFDDIESKFESIANKIESAYLFKDLEDRIHFDKHGEIISMHSNTHPQWHFTHNQEYLEECLQKSKETNINEFEEDLKYIYYQFLYSIHLNSDSPDYEIAFVKFLSNIGEKIRNNYPTEVKLIETGDIISKKAQEKLKILEERRQLKSIDLFKKDDDYSFDVLKKCNDLLIRFIDYLTPMKEIQEKLNDKDLSFEELVEIIENSKPNKDMDDELQEELRIFLNTMFCISNVKKDNHEDISIFDAYGYEIFLYLIKVTVELAQHNFKASVN